jgi:hypothetical protein
MKISFVLLAATWILFAFLQRRRRKNIPRPHPLDWRVGHVGRDQMYYEELVEGTWQRIPIDGEMSGGRAHHVIYFASEEEWKAYPDWARDRRSEIVARIKKAFSPPDYEHHET